MKAKITAQTDPVKGFAIQIPGFDKALMVSQFVH